MVDNMDKNVSNLLKHNGSGSANFTKEYDRYLLTKEISGADKMREAHLDLNQINAERARRILQLRN